MPERVTAQRRRQLALLHHGHADAQRALLVRLHGAGWTPEGLAGLRLGDLLPSPARSRLIGFRCALQLPYGSSAPLAVDDEGRALGADDVELALVLATA